MRFVVGVFRLIWVGLLVCFVLFAVLVLFRFISSSTKGRMIRRVAAWLPMAFGIRVRVKGRVPDEGSRSTGISSRGKGYLICANHISFADFRRQSRNRALAAFWGHHDGGRYDLHRSRQSKGYRSGGRGDECGA